MAINFLPISFHDSRMASDGLGAGFGGAAFLASCAKAGIAASITATSRAPHLLTLFIVPLLFFFVCFGPAIGPVLAGTPSLTDSMAKRFSPFRAHPWPIGRGSSYDVIWRHYPASWKIHRSRHGRLVARAWRDAPLELDLAVGKQRDWPDRRRTVVFLAAVLVSRDLAGDVKLGKPEAARCGAADLCGAVTAHYRRDGGRLSHGAQPSHFRRQYNYDIRGTVVFQRDLRLFSRETGARP